MDLLNGLAAIATCLSFGVILWRGRSSARRVKVERARVAKLEERLRAARVSARLGTEQADQLVQRLKGTIRTSEALNAARTIRATLRTLDGQLADDPGPLETVPAGQLIESAATDVARRLTTRREHPG